MRLARDRQRVLGRRYRLVDRCGVGGMAEVWRAWDTVLHRDVAVKILTRKLTGDSASQQRIRAEAMAIARVSHPNVTNVFDYGESRGVPYVVMELLDGQSLAERLRESFRLSWKQTARIGAQVAAALAVAHARGVVHRDIKPANIMLTTNGVKVFDFGIAGFAGSPDSDEPNGMVLGTPAYLAPERLLGETIVAQTDVYAVGLLLHRCLTGTLPWHAETTTQMITNHCYEPPRPLPAIDGLPPAVAAVVDACLAKAPADRPTAACLAEALATAAGIHVVLPSDPDAATDEVPAAIRPAVGGGTADPGGGVGASRTDRRRLVLAGTAVAVVALGGAAMLASDPAGAPVRSPAEAVEVRQPLPSEPAPQVGDPSVSAPAVAPSTPRPPAPDAPGGPPDAGVPDGGVPAGGVPFGDNAQPQPSVLGSASPPATPSASPSATSTVKPKRSKKPKSIRMP